MLSCYKVLACSETVSRCDSEVMPSGCFADAQEPAQLQRQSRGLRPDRRWAPKSL